MLTLAMAVEALEFASAGSSSIISSLIWDADLKGFRWTVLTTTGIMNRQIAGGQLLRNKRAIVVQQNSNA